MDNAGNALTWNGSSWSSATSIDGTYSLNSVSCTSSTWCVAVDSHGQALGYYVSSWSLLTSTPIDSGHALDAVACTTTTWCMAVDNDGNALAITHGSGWSSSPADIDGTYQLDAISCPTSFLCEAVDNDGNDLTFNGTVWSNPEHIDYSRTIEGISCPTTSFCAAVDNLGGVLESQPDTVISQLTWGSVSGGLPSILSDSANDYIYGPNGTPVEAVALSTGAPTFLTYNPSDGTWISANAAGDETGFWGYDAYGSLLFGTPTSSFGYGGQYLDAATGLSDMRARYYDPATGEFMSVDPDVSQTDRPYAYAGDDPVNESDPTGRSTLGICGELSIVLGGGYGFNGCAFLGQRGWFGQIEFCISV